MSQSPRETEDEGPHAAAALSPTDDPHNTTSSNDNQVDSASASHHDPARPGSPTMSHHPDDPNDPGYEFEVKEQDRWLPIANVARIMKLALPDNAKIAKEAKECMQECVSEFISFITSEASEKCQQEKRKTVNGEDILFAMASLGFENYGEALKIYLARYRENLVAKGDQPTKAGGNATGAADAYDENHHPGAAAAGPGAAGNDFDYANPAPADY